MTNKHRVDFNELNNLVQLRAECSSRISTLESRQNRKIRQWVWDILPDLKSATIKNIQKLVPSFHVPMTGRFWFNQKVAVSRIELCFKLENYVKSCYIQSLYSVIKEISQKLDLEKQTLQTLNRQISDIENHISLSVPKNKPTQIDYQSEDYAPMSIHQNVVPFEFDQNVNSLEISKPTFVSGNGGDFGAGGATGSFELPELSRYSEPEPQYSSSSDSSSSDSSSSYD